MENTLKLWTESGFANLTPGNAIMYVVAGVLLYLAVAKDYEPLLLIPIGFGIAIANLPGASLGSNDPEGLMHLIYKMGIKSELMPPVIFLGVGALTDFRPLLGRPITFLLGAAAQVGIFGALLGAFYLSRLIAPWLGEGFEPFSIYQASAIGIIGGADGPTSIYLATRMAPELLGAIAVAAYSYMALVPIIQPPVMRLLTTQAEREIDMPQAKPVSRAAVIIFPVVTAILSTLVVPSAGPLLGMLMYGNLLRESGVTERLSKTAGSQLIDIVTMFLGLTVGATMSAQSFLRAQTLLVLAMGLVAFVAATAGGVLFAKLLNLFLPERSRMNPCIGAAGVSAVPMSARVVQKFVSDATGGRVNPLMSAMGPNVAGVIGSAVAAGALLALVGRPPAVAPPVEPHAAVAVSASAAPAEVEAKNAPSPPERREVTNAAIAPAAAPGSARGDGAAAAPGVAAPEPIAPPADDEIPPLRRTAPLPPGERATPEPR